MDPLSAISLAGNAVQFVEIALKIVSKTREISKSASGAGVQHEDIQASTSELSQVRNWTRKNRSKAASRSTIRESESEVALDDLLDNIAQICNRLCAALTKAASGSSSKQWKSLRQAVKSVLGNDEVISIYERLREHRERAAFLLILITSNKQGEIQESLDAMHRQNDVVLEETQKIRADLLATLHQLSQAQTTVGDVDRSKLYRVLNLLAGLSEKSGTDTLNEMVIQSLQFPRMQDRFEVISEANAQTFQWVFEPGGPPEELGESADVRKPRRTWSSLVDWMRSDKGVYWIGGKAGSGKSTLMKYIAQSNRMKPLLETWAGESPLTTASFYFWNPGTSMQKSGLGLLQSLLYEILMQQPDLVPLLFPARIKHKLSMLDVEQNPWTVSELNAAIKKLANGTLKRSYFFIIDGLDEFDGELSTLIDIVNEIGRNTNMKLLVSSRPWPVFQDNFSNCPKLMLEQLTMSDIQRFVNDRFQSSARYSALMAREPESAAQLLGDIVNRASGVFLWVYLVTKSLLEGLSNADRMSDLRRRLRAIPEDLEQFFLHMLGGIDSFYKGQASRYFRFALVSRRPLDPLIYSFLDEEDVNFAVKCPVAPLSEVEENDRRDEIGRRLGGCCKGLLEIHVMESKSLSRIAKKVEHEVHFLHRTVSEFLLTPTASTHLVAMDSSSFNAQFELAKANLAAFKSFRSQEVEYYVESAEYEMRLLVELSQEVLRYISAAQHDVAEAEQHIVIETLQISARSLLQQRPAAWAVCLDQLAYEVNDPLYTRWLLSCLEDNDRASVSCSVPAASFVALCVQFDLQEYLEALLREDKAPLLCAEGRPPLLYAFKGRARAHDVFQKHDNPPFTDVSLGMLRVLLAAGADVNAPDFDNTTVWFKVVYTIDRLAMSNRLNVNADKWSQVALAMIEAGAKLDAPQGSKYIGIVKDVGVNGKSFNSRHGEASNTMNPVEVLKKRFAETPAGFLLRLEDAIAATPQQVDVGSAVESTNLGNIQNEWSNRMLTQQQGSGGSNSYEQPLIMGSTSTGEAPLSGSESTKNHLSDAESDDEDVVHRTSSQEAATRLEKNEDGRCLG